MTATTPSAPAARTASQNAAEVARHLTATEQEAGLTAEELAQLVGLVEHDESRDPFPVTGWDAVVFVVGNATQAAHY